MYKQGKNLEIETNYKKRSPLVYEAISYPYIKNININVFQSNPSLIIHKQEGWIHDIGYECVDFLVCFHIITH